MLFNTYSEEILQKALEDKIARIKINGTSINNIRYADDTVILAKNMEDLQRLMDKVAECSEGYGLTLNIKKTKFMRISKRNLRRESLMINGNEIQQMERYTYLGTMISSDNDYTNEIRIRIEKARTTFMKMKKILTNLTLHLRFRLVKCYIFSTLLYGVEAWTMNALMLRKLEALEMWIYRKMLRISWIERVTNVEILRRMGKERELINTIKGRKLQYLGHITRGVSDTPCCD